MIKRGDWGLLICLAAFASLASGCDSRPHSDKPSGKVTIKVVYGGVPVRNARISLDNAKTGMAVAGELDAEGTVTFDEVFVGPYRVTVIPPLPDQVAVAPGMPAPELEERDDIPRKFRDLSTTPLQAEVFVEANDFTFELKDAEE